MPKTIMTNSQPNEYLFQYLNETGHWVFVSGRRWNGDRDPMKNDIQVLDYGIAIWQSPVYRKVILWADVKNLTERFV